MSEIAQLKQKIDTSGKDGVETAQLLNEIERLQKAQYELARYFTSGNSIPVERATILAKDFWRITGLTPK